jgi:hypothetical protein
MYVEYKTFNGSFDNMERDLNKFAKEGWRVIKCQFQEIGHWEQTYYAKYAVLMERVVGTVPA